MHFIFSFYYKGHRKYFSFQTGNTACYLLYEIAKQPELQEHLIQEMSSVLGNKAHPSWDDLQKMTLLRNCVKEVMRLHNLLPATARVIAEDVVLLGYQVPAGVSSVEERCILYQANCVLTG